MNESKNGLTFGGYGNQKIGRTVSPLRLKLIWANRMTLFKVDAGLYHKQ